MDFRQRFCRLWRKHAGHRVRRGFLGGWQSSVVFGFRITVFLFDRCSSLAGKKEGPAAIDTLCTGVVYGRRDSPGGDSYHTGPAGPFFVNTVWDGQNGGNRFGLLT